MPEMLEIEYYRGLAERALDRVIESVAVLDPHCLKGPLGALEFGSVLVGNRFVAARRTGKLLSLDTLGPVVGVRFGMTGGLVVDDVVAIDGLLYSSPEVFGGRWIRLQISFADGGELALHDQRRFGRVELNPDEAALGPDAFRVTPSQLARALASRRPGGPPLKARLQDQAHLAGLGNLLVDEILWRAGLSPVRPCDSLDPRELRRLHRRIRTTLDDLYARGGSHMGDLQEQRHVGGICPRDATPLTRMAVGGRTTYWCPHHQR
jgi:formamidopyrimidine-DNA glycosylase